ncbi:MAG: hypothetical protein HC927_09255 [Deltaproteobacteria bacterium]|nr:hypothetical protein [Deltaproteobacteria bacterium]
MSYFDDTQRALAVLVALIRGPQPLEGRVRIQKMMYLLKALGLPGLERIRYAYHHYGPYSEQIAGAMRRAVASGLIVEDKEQFDDEWQKFTYALDAEHPDASYLELGADQLELVERVKLAVADRHWRVLELAATVVFLEREAQVERHEALRRALGHKPACEPYKNQALDLLERLGL